MTIRDTLGINTQIHSISKKFFADLEQLGELNRIANVCALTEEFFEKMKGFKKQEFADFLEMQQIIKENSMNQNSIDAFYCLTSLIVTNYPESDLARYFLPKELTKEIKPERSNSNWRVIYWLRLLGYWAAKLLGREKYQYTDPTENNNLVDAITDIRKSMLDKPYIQLQTKPKFSENLRLIMENAVKSIPLNYNDTLSPKIPNTSQEQNKINDVENLISLDEQNFSNSQDTKIPLAPKFVPEKYAAPYNIENPAISSQNVNENLISLDEQNFSNSQDTKIPPPPKFDPEKYAAIHNIENPAIPSPNVNENLNALPNATEDNKEILGDPRANLFAQIQQGGFNLKKINIDEVPELFTNVQSRLKENDKGNEKSNKEIPFSNIGDAMRAVIDARFPAMHGGPDESGDDSDNDNIWSDTQDNDTTDSFDISNKTETDSVRFDKPNPKSELQTVTLNEVDMAFSNVLQSLFSENEGNKENNISSKKLILMIKKVICAQRTINVFKKGQQQDVATTSSASLFKQDQSSCNIDVGSAGLYQEQANLYSPK